jgi:tyrosyl-tRNA synthetase
MTKVSTAPPQSPALAELTARGYVEQLSDAERCDLQLAKEMVSFYIGFDPTASCIHVGNLLGVMAMRVMQKHGHRPICLIGGGTARVGDPSGKIEMRKMLEEDQIETNAGSMAKVFARYLHFDSGAENDAILLDNADWLMKLAYLPFLRDVGRHFTINRMIATKTYRDRLENEQPLSFLEFNYQLLQAYDFLHLYREHGCCLQMGGSDQWGNIIAGVELIRRTLGADAESSAPAGEAPRASTFAITTPLLTTADGRKMGKTERGAVWLDAERVKPYDFYQFWINVDDRDVSKLLRLYTELPLDEIEELTSVEGKALRTAKARLAFEATALAHGADEAERAATASKQAFSGDADWSALPCIEIDGDEVALVDLLVDERLAAFKSKRAARQRIEDGAVRIAGESVKDAKRIVTRADGGEDGVHLRVGKKHRFRVTFR